MWLKETSSQRAWGRPRTFQLMTQGTNMNPKSFYLTFGVHFSLILLCYLLGMAARTAFR